MKTVGEDAFQMTFFSNIQDQNFENGEVHHGAKIWRIAKKSTPLMEDLLGMIPV